MNTENYYTHSSDQEAERQAQLLNAGDLNTQELDFISDVLQNIQGPCLDIACGKGDFAFLLAKHYGPETQVYGLDAIDDLIEAANNKAQQKNCHNLKFIQADIVNNFAELEMQDNFPDQFQIIHIRYLLCHLTKEDRAIVFDFIDRHLAKKGYLITGEGILNASLDNPLAKPIKPWIDICNLWADYKGCDYSYGTKLQSDLEERGFNILSSKRLVDSLDTAERKLSIEQDYDDMLQALKNESIDCQQYESADIRRSLHDFCKDENSPIALVGEFIIAQR